MGCAKLRCLYKIVMNNIYKDFKAALGVVLAICIITIFIQLVLHGALNWTIIKEQLFYNAYYGFPLTFFGSWFFDYLNRKISWDDRPAMRAILGIFGTIVSTMLVLIALNFFLWTVIQGKSINTIWNEEHRLFYIIGIIITIVVTSLMHAIGFFKEVQAQKEISYNLKQQKLSSELNALRAHVNPHFLFNSFNVLSGLIEEDKDSAQTFLSGLSKIYRYILEQRNEDTCTVEEEVAFAEKYLDLHRMRFENGIRLSLEVGETQFQQKIPSLSLQLLLENAIKHNAFDASNPLHIELTSSNDFLIVKNNTAFRKDLVVSSGVGLQNIRDRYKILSEKEIDVISNENEFIVKLPYL